MVKTKLVLVATLLITTLSTIAAPPAEEGKAIFTSRCTGCHNVNKMVVGPALAGVDQRRPIDWIINFVHSSQKVVKSGDPYAVALFNKFNKIQMPDHPDLTADNIKSVVEYIKVEAKAANQKPAVQPETKQPNLITMILSNSALIATFSVLLLLLFASIVLLLKVQQMQRSKNL